MFENMHNYNKKKVDNIYEKKNRNLIIINILINYLNKYLYSY